MMYFERLRLKKALKGFGGNYKRPQTAQDSIPFKRMYRSGICQVTDRYYTKMIEFFDLNYAMLDESAQDTLREKYGKMIRLFEPDVHIEIVLFNRQANEQLLTDQIKIPLQGDDVDPIRDEFAGMLKKVMSKGKNGQVKSKYLIFGVEASSYKYASERLGNIEKEVMAAFMGLGARARSVSGVKRIKILHEYFNQYSRTPSNFSYELMNQSGQAEKDFVAPVSFNFEDDYSYMCDRMIGEVNKFDIQATTIKDDIIRKLIAIDDNITIAIHMDIMSPADAIKLVKWKLTDVQKDKINYQKDANRGGFDMDILPPDMATKEAALMTLYQKLSTTNENLVNASFLVNCCADSRAKLNSLIQRVMGIAQPAGCELIPLAHLQEQALMASAPIGINESEVNQLLTTGCISALIPFNTQELFQDGEALYYGQNSMSGNMIMADRKRLRTPNGVILGTPGSGKSFAAKREILGCFLQTKDDILICDIEREYAALTAALHGQVIKLATNSNDYINPMDIRIDYGNENDTMALRNARKEAINQKADFIITLCNEIAGGEKGLGNDEAGIIDKCVTTIYERFFEDEPSAECMPTLEDLHRELSIHSNPLAERIANCLELYVHGSQNYFNHRSNVDIQNRIVCFDIKELSNQLSRLGMLIVQDAVWNRVTVNRERRVATRYYCDEFHKLLASPQTAAFMVNIWKRFRKWGGIPTALTQNVTDFLRSPEIEGIIGNSDFVLLLNQSEPDQKVLAKMLGLSERQLEKVTGAEPGAGLIRYDNIVIPFEDKYPTNTKSYAIMTTRMSESAVR